eukprot:g1807.t1
MHRFGFHRCFSFRSQAVMAANTVLDHKSAVCFIPPRKAWDSIQEIRCFNDKSFVRWPPHINLLYPFWKYNETDFDTASRRLRRVLQKFSSSKLTLNHFSFFEHGNTCTVWLQPESSNLASIQEALVEEFPECFHLNNDPSRNINQFIPHLSVGQWPNQRSAQEAISSLSRTFQPIEMQLSDVMMICRASHQKPFEIKVKIPIGSNKDDDIEWISTGYVASLGATSSDSSEQFPYGIGSYTDGVWNFAYGANVNQEKLVHGRDITPLESIPGILKKHKLSFNHQGGMGNVELMSSASASYFKARGIDGVHGILHRLSLTDYARLTNIESGYRPVEHLVETKDGRGSVLAIVFQSPKHRCIRDGLPPPDRYLQLICKGAKEWNLDSQYINWLENVPFIPSKDRGPLYWRTSEGVRINDRIIRVGADPPKDTRRFQRNVKRERNAHRQFNV